MSRTRTELAVQQYSPEDHAEAGDQEPNEQTRTEIGSRDPEAAGIGQLLDLQHPGAEGREGAEEADGQEGPQVSMSGPAFEDQYEEKAQHERPDDVDSECAPRESAAC